MDLIPFHSQPLKGIFQSVTILAQYFYVRQKSSETMCLSNLLHFGKNIQIMLMRGDEQMVNRAQKYQATSHSTFRPTSNHTQRHGN